MISDPQLRLPLRRKQRTVQIWRIPARPRTPEQAEHRMQRRWCPILSLLIAPPGILSPKGVVWWALDHAAAISRAAGGERKARGVIAGIPDLVFHGPLGRVLYLEIKTARGRPSSTRIVKRNGHTSIVLGQNEVHAALAGAGVPTVIVRTFPAVLAALTLHGIPLTRQPLSLT